MQNAEKLIKDNPSAESAEAIIAAERKAATAKTARLREARLAKEAADLLAHALGKPREKVLNAKKDKP
jgi:hypothetical protein